MATWHNWARTEAATPYRFETPGTVDELVSVVGRSADDGSRLKAVGAGHSFTGVAVTDGTLVSLDRISGIESVEATATGADVTVRAGTRLRELNALLWERGLALANLGDIDAQSIAGAISTGTHGTGAQFGGLAAQVRGATLVLADGSVVQCSPTRDPALFEAARLGLGAVGILVTVTLACVPAFRLHAEEAPASLRDTLDRLDDERLGIDHFEFYWFPHTERVLTKRNTRLPGAAPTEPVGRIRGFVDDEVLSNGVFGAFQQLGTRVPALIPGLNSVSARALAPRRFTDRSYRVFASARRVRFREMEYAVPTEALPTVLAEIDTWIRRSDTRIGFPVEVRFASADDVWLSTAYGRDTAYVAVHQYHRREHDAYFAATEAIACAVGGRPHWGKLHDRTADDLRPAYPRFDDFLAVRDRVDPQRVFGNAYLQRVLGEDS
ncbi:D-arabinono-1,4-lactone oxidase [Rhodococcus chondri]|uniref:D-arabinono-1,4-lactone oxidase n=1 Tax=Rhodococcus chondri TaxID=3065941 RepID=A0ABU7JTV9_9NOCA|nr:D-arabinono-1,4-lactone oxidase [Rhodococcus sp. CC-R104]MEE2033452.1 D-arabinono-1,4-lactone oxidase [Rhodococcus sp. CC-R104]